MRTHALLLAALAAVPVLADAAVARGRWRGPRACQPRPTCPATCPPAWCVTPPVAAGVGPRLDELGPQAAELNRRMAAAERLLIYHDNALLRLTPGDLPDVPHPLERRLAALEEKMGRIEAAVEGVYRRLEQRPAGPPAVSP